MYIIVKKYKTIMWVSFNFGHSFDYAPVFTLTLANHGISMNTPIHTHFMLEYDFRTHVISIVE